MTLFSFADNPPASCARGLSDHERDVDDEFWSAGQYTDSKWIVPHEGADSMATSKGNGRRWVSGRCIIQHEGMQDNKWASSGLFVSGPWQNAVHNLVYPPHVSCSFFTLMLFCFFVKS